jgi:hypothetical protein
VLTFGWLDRHYLEFLKDRDGAKNRSLEIIRLERLIGCKRASFKEGSGRYSKKNVNPKTPEI